MDNSDLYKVWYVIMKALEYGPLKKGALSRGNARELQLREVGFLKMLKG